MDQDLSQPDKLRARRDAMRERLRAKADKVLVAVEDMADPKTFIEVDRAARAIIATDKMIVQLFSAPKAVSFDVRFGGSDSDDERKRSRSQRMPVEAAESSQNSENSLGNAPIVASGDTSPLRYAKGEDKSVEAPSAVIHDTKPVSGRLTKRQKRRQRAFKSQGVPVVYGAGLSP